MSSWAASQNSYLRFKGLFEPKMAIIYTRILPEPEKFDAVLSKPAKIQMRRILGAVILHNAQDLMDYKIPTLLGVCGAILVFV